MLSCEYGTRGCAGRGDKHACTPRELQPEKRFIDQLRELSGRREERAQRQAEDLFNNVVKPEALAKAEAGLYEAWIPLPQATVAHDVYQALCGILAREGFRVKDMSERRFDIRIQWSPGSEVGHRG